MRACARARARVYVCVCVCVCVNIIIIVFNSVYISTLTTRLCIVSFSGGTGRVGAVCILLV